MHLSAIRESNTASSPCHCAPSPAHCLQNARCLCAARQCLTMPCMRWQCCKAVQSCEIFSCMHDMNAGSRAAAPRRDVATHRGSPRAHPPGLLAPTQPPCAAASDRTHRAAHPSDEVQKYAHLDVNYFRLLACFVFRVSCSISPLWLLEMLLGAGIEHYTSTVSAQSAANALTK